MRVTWDKSVDAAYVYLVDKMAPGGAATTVALTPDEAAGSFINLDLSAEGVLLGIEILGASRALPKELLDQAEIIG